VRLSFSTASLFPRDTIDSLKLIEIVGFQYAELMPQCFKETKPDFAKKLSREINIKVSSIHFPLIYFSVFYNPYPGILSEARNMVNDLTAMADILESEIIVIHPPYFNDEVIESVFYDPVIENMRYLCERSKEYGIKVALENSPKGGRTPEEMLEIIDKIGHENLFPMVDTTEAVESGQDPIEMIKALEIVHIHASDHKEGKKHVPPGEGSLNWGEIVSMLREKNFSGLFTVEPSYRYFLKDPVERMRSTLRFLERLLR